MNREEILKQMDLAVRQDRERFFRVADTLHLQPKYAAYTTELEAIKQQWRDITAAPDYPNIDWPLLLPQWFPVIYFASKFKKDKYIEEVMQNARND